jgi:F-type H+-transporting ATPase subunit a
MSSRFHENGGVYNGFYIPTTGAYAGKIVEKDPSTGAEIKPWNFSISKDVAELLMVVILVTWVFLYCARWYAGRKPSDAAPKGFVGFMEMFVTSINDDVIKSSIGEKHYRKYSPYLLTVFFFVFTCNLVGMIPIFPAGANITGNITITFFLAVCTFLMTNLFGNKHYWKDIFWPEVPTWLKVPVPMMPVIEFFGVFTKPFALMVRLFANMLAGHAIIISLVCIIFITFQMGIIAGTSLTLVSIVMTIFMDFLELLVSFIQAYVFTMLSAVFIGLAHLEPENK